MLQQCNTYVICPVDDAVGDETCQPKTSINIWQWCEWSNKKNKNTMSSVRTSSVRTVPESNKKNCRNRGKMNNLNTHIHDHSLSWHGACTSINNGGVKLFLFALIPSWWNHSLMQVLIFYMWVDW